MGSTCLRWVLLCHQNFEALLKIVILRLISLADFSSRGPHLSLPAETGRVLKCSEWVDFEVVFVAAEIRWLSLNDGQWRHVEGSQICASFTVVLVLLTF